MTIQSFATGLCDQRRNNNGELLDEPWSSPLLAQSYFPTNHYDRHSAEGMEANWEVGSPVLPKSSEEVGDHDLSWLACISDALTLQSSVQKRLFPCDPRSHQGGEDERRS